MATYTIDDNMSVVLCSGDDIGGTMLVACDLSDESDNTIRRATLQECLDSHAAGAEGWFRVDGQRCYVELD